MISFIVPAHNEEALLGATLWALHESARAAGEPYELIVADDSSTDRTSSIAAEHGARVVPVRRRQIAATRNAGAREARGDVFFFVDADTLASAAAVRAGVRALRRGAVGGGCMFRFAGRVPLWARLVYPAGAAAGRVFQLIGGCFLFCTREAFRQAGGFDEGCYAAEEWGFIKALKRRGRFVIPRETVVTSARKLRTLTARQLLGLLLRLAVRGPRAYRSREGLDLWYGERAPEAGAGGAG
jgi:glycosyltransferase involved in cell wall biosynthesis